MPDPGIEDEQVVHLIQTLDMRLISPCNLTSFLVDETITRFIHKRRNSIDQYMCDALAIGIRDQVMCHMYNTVPYNMEPDEFAELVDDDVDTVMQMYPELRTKINKRVMRLGDLGEGNANIVILHGMPQRGALLIRLEDCNE